MKEITFNDVYTTLVPEETIVIRIQNEFGDDNIIYDGIPAYKVGHEFMGYKVVRIGVSENGQNLVIRLKKKEAGETDF